MKCLLTTAAQTRQASAKLAPANDYGGGAPPMRSNLRPEEYSKSLDCEDSSSADTMDQMKFTHPPGSRPLDRYTIRRGVGVGGFGEVYFAVSDAGKEVALKRIQRHLEIELRGVRQCLNLKHPNVISLYDIQQDDDDGWWVVMEYVAGENLRDRLDRESNGMALPEVRLAFAQIASGVDYLHQMGLVHRDLKPGNIFDDIGTMKVGDCGLSKFISATQRGGQTESVGTFHYMAPEIGRGEYGRGIDIYALGVILFEMVTGRVPFEGESSQEIIVKHLTDRVDTTGIDKGIAKIIDRAMSKKPEDRYATVEQMANDFENACRLSIGEAFPASVTPQGDNVPEAVLDLEPVYVARTMGESPGVGNQPRQPDARNNQTGKSPEPIAAAAKSATDEVRVWWNGMESRPAVRFALVVAASVALMTQAPWLVPLLVFGLTIYAIYYVGRSLVLGDSTDPALAQTLHAYPNVPATSPPMAKAQWRAMMRQDLRSRTKLTRSAELTTSLSTASVGTLVLSAIAALIGLGRGPFDAVALAPYVLAASTVFGISWSLLVLSKTWERGDGDNLSRRLASTGVGAVAGAMFYSLGSVLMVPMNEGLVRDVDASALPSSLYSISGPTLGAVMAHFALLFCLLRWWRCVDPLRRTRLSLWGVAVAVVGEWLLHQFLPIPQPTGMMVAGGVAMVIQLSSPWMDFREHVEAQRKSNVTNASAGHRVHGGARTMEVTG
ncbi:MAG: serine/threonine-protein kinase [Planctomycetota bacterium]